MMKTLLKYLFPVCLVFFLAGCKKEKTNVDTAILAGIYKGDITVSYSMPGMGAIPGMELPEEMEDNKIPDVEIELASTAPNKITIVMPEDMDTEDVDFAIPELSSDVSYKNGVYNLSGSTEITLPEPIEIPVPDLGGVKIEKLTVTTSGTIDKDGNANVKIDFSTPAKIPIPLPIDMKFNFVITFNFVGKKVN
ncbi:MAG: hypothetical protein LBG92_00980 [Prevotellaceae bacterium]|nr:hypothetical protein [Prevotellaceae bacterium]